MSIPLPSVPAYHLLRSCFSLQVQLPYSAPGLLPTQAGGKEARESAARGDPESDSEAGGAPAIRARRSLATALPRHRERPNSM